MELIVTSFLLVGLSLFGHIGTVIAEQLRRPQRRVFRVADHSHEPPPLKRASTASHYVPAEPAAA